MDSGVYCDVDPNNDSLMRVLTPFNYTTVESGMEVAFKFNNINNPANSIQQDVIAEQFII